MSLGTEVNLKVVLDTNIIVSAVGYGGKPGNIFLLALEKKIQAVTSEILLAELREILTKKLFLSPEDIEIIIVEIEDKFTLVQPQKTLHRLEDEDDNRVLEAAIEGGCQYIITGDKALLKLQTFRKIKIMDAKQFLDEVRDMKPSFYHSLRS